MQAIIIQQLTKGKSISQNIKINWKCLIFNGINSLSLNAVFKTDYIKNKYMFQCTDNIIAVLNTAFTKDVSIPSNIKHFTIEFEIDDVHYNFITWSLLFFWGVSEQTYAGI